MEKNQLEKYYEVLTNASPDCIKLMDLEGNLVYINKGGMEEHGLTSLEDAIKNKWRAVDTVVPEDKMRFAQAMQDALNGKISTIELTHLSDQSNRGVCLETVAPVKDDAGKVIGIFGVSRDITSMKAGEQKLQGKIAELEEMNKIMVERELKMIELKAEIKKLKEKETKLI
ncbi:hypothetical protein A3I18_00240 [Candidatus Campbellbacteria bacterium RIFCSPLOWO2_02_FULL_35_11]|uniref:PAC domain-containing protein n=2 Tax=Candidatus Campbelliibacteriota TaxID=1752727 RepID=A0A1F5ENP5_9BACT|nr:MAG: hypothetical protein A3E89_01195 [Candidatus Campbellbacteria bacterium RIFCSPHIGHO2_12_FULL_35_10]OGD70067.1 MAG: hypothetical protein A3I18_00240 [Candidatus Campbellbacteria bacterium RIFCSPLOWO2_02_FULL_35_11]